MSKEKFDSEANESGMINYMFRIYGNTLRESDFDHTGCRKLYKRLLHEGLIEKNSDDLDPLVKLTEKGRSYIDSKIK